jgi:ATP-dependent Clp protease ATP-binding subunit ClpA
VLDEIEKAHPDLFNILLQVMDSATLTDNNGRKADFRSVVLIMTTNAGSREMDRSKVGFANVGPHVQQGKNKALDRMFSPEFRNRLDGIVHFSGLPPDIVRLVVDKFLLELEGQLTDKKVSIDITDSAREWLAKQGYDPKFGARPMTRVIHEHIRKPLADELLFGSLIDGGKVLVDRKVKPDELPEGEKFEDGLVVTFPE